MVKRQLRSEQREEPGAHVENCRASWSRNLCGLVPARQRLLLRVRIWIPHLLKRTANYFLYRAASKEEILKGGVTVASLFFGKVFGPAAQRALSVFVALR